MTSSSDAAQEAIAKAWVDAWQQQAASVLHQPETLRFLFTWLESLTHATPPVPPHAGTAPFPPVSPEPRRDDVARLEQRIATLEQRLAAYEATAAERRPAGGAARSKTTPKRPAKRD